MVVTVLGVAWELYLQYKPEPKGRFPEQVGQVRLEDQPYGGFLVNIAEWLNNELELAVFTQGPVKFAEFFEGLAGWVYRNVEGQIEKLWISIGRLLVALSEGTLRKVEEDATRSTTAVMGNALNSLADYEKNVLKKSLRWDLAWIPFLLVMILVMLFVL
jgi:hypothetical protein